MKRNCKATLNVFFKNKKFDDDKKLYLHDNFFESNQNFTAKHVNIPGFFKDLCSKFA